MDDGQGWQEVLGNRARIKAHGEVSVVGGLIAGSLSKYLFTLQHSLRAGARVCVYAPTKGLHLKSQ
jgi:hypothetical protein